MSKGESLQSTYLGQSWSVSWHVDTCIYSPRVSLCNALTSRRQKFTQFVGTQRKCRVNLELRPALLYHQVFLSSGTICQTLLTTKCHWHHFINRFQSSKKKKKERINTEHILLCPLLYVILFNPHRKASKCFHLHFIGKETKQRDYVIFLRNGASIHIQGYLDPNTVFFSLRHVASALFLCFPCNIFQAFFSLCYLWTMCVRITWDHY